MSQQYEVRLTCFRVSCYQDVIRPCLEVLDVVPVVSQAFGHGDTVEIEQRGARQLLHL